MFKKIRYDIKTIMERDPAARCAFEVFMLYPGFSAVLYHRAANWFYKRRMFFTARLISQVSSFATGIEIHPAAKIGKGLFIDHGNGVVVGETAEIGDNCTIYQGVTLGGTGKDKGKRHPTIGNNVIIGAGAKVLGPFKVGNNVKIAANAVVLNEVPDNCTCVGVPARIVKRDNVRIFSAFDHVHTPDPIYQDICSMLGRIERLEGGLSKLSGKEQEDEDI